MIRAAVALAAVLSCAAGAVAPITVGEGGVVMRDGVVWRGIGINYFSAFRRALDDPADTTYRAGFAELSRRGIPFVRFMAGGFWPRDWRLYLDDRESWFRLMDGVVRAAEENHVGLIASLFWYDACVPDLVGEPRSAWGDPGSKTHAFMRQYVKEVVTRYLESPAIWAWELGNEYSLAADLPNAADHRPWIHPGLGTPESRGPADDLTHDMIVTASREFAKAVRQYDARRPVTTGHSLPRSSAHNQRIGRQWAQDTPEQFASNLIEVTPEPADTISVHVYPFDKDKRFGRDCVTYAEVLRICMDTARKGGKALFIGEFGAPDTEKDGGREKARAECLEQIQAILDSGAPLAALWNYDLPSQEDFINITPINHRGYLLDELERANRAIAASGQER